MNGTAVTPIEIERAAEQLRQERATFDQQRTQDERWFTLRLVMGYSSITLLAAVFVVSSWIVFHASQFAPPVANAAGGALFVDTVGLVVSIWRGVLRPNSAPKLAPVTKVKVPALPSPQ